MVYKCINVPDTPEYLKELLCHRTFKRQSRLANQEHRLEVPHTSKKTFAARCFSVKGPQLWNSLPNSLRAIQELEHLKRELKTYLFNKYF